jgi:predicted nuclease of predicted toxin-antitoxin system
VIWVRLGNCSTEQIVALLRHRHHEIAAFLADEDAAFLALA